MEQTIKNLFKPRQPLYGYKFIFKRLGIEVDEIISECYIEVCSALTKHRPHPEKWNAFIYTICRRKCFKMYIKECRYNNTFKPEDGNMMDEKYPHVLTTTFTQEDEYLDKEKAHFIHTIEDEVVDLFTETEKEVLLGEVEMKEVAKQSNVEYKTLQRCICRKKAVATKKLEEIMK
jgi:DNA-directed RNA polymerase specialized sigma24 family protein